MRRGELFWGPLLIILGLLFFLKTAGYLVGDVFGWFWPLLVIAVGAWVLAGAFSRSRYETAEKFSVPLQGAQRGVLAIHHGAGRIDLRAGASPGDFLTGVSGMGMKQSTRLNDGTLEVTIEAGPSFLPFIGPESGAWEYRLSNEVPLTIKVEAGASRLDLDLTDLRVTDLSFDGGASSMNVSLPARVEHVHVDIDAGAAHIDLRVPEGVALRFRGTSVGSLEVDESRFPRRESGLYQSADYDSAAYHADVTLDGGATSVRVH
jgi:hypothetical protein